jgi:tagatose-6-phosphate ketose/aldose isomerase
MTAVDPSETRNELTQLASHPAEAQVAMGYGHTLREIVQQPATWQRTAAQMRDEIRTQGGVRQLLKLPPSHVVLTGSGSSHYIGLCLSLGMQQALGLPVQSVSAGTLLTHWPGVIRPGALLVSFARSGDSPESAAVVDTLLQQAPDCRHLFFTCNAQGRLALAYREEPRVKVIVLDDATNDRSLVMTSSFTNLVLAGRAMAAMDDETGYLRCAAVMAEAGERLLDRYSDAVATIARGNYSNVVYLGSGGRFGAAREAALKMLEMTGGRTLTFAETFLGLRHGPMSALDHNSLLVAFLSSDSAIRAYELDLLGELARKQLGTTRIVVGSGIPAALAEQDSLIIDLPELSYVSDDDATLTDAMIGQLLGFFRCLHMGLQPDAPAQGVLTRVVENFAIHRNGS